MNPINRPLKAIIDTDPGVDDAIAILMALSCPNLEVLGLTTVGGNVSLARGSRNALALLEYAGRQEVPVSRGSARPLRGRFPYSRDFHGPSGLSRRLPQPRTRAIETRAVEFLADRLRENPQDGITLIALGPLTNLARLLRQDPESLNHLASLVVMGGAVSERGNVTPYAEFNFYSDPVAAHRVLSSGIPLTLVDLKACRRVHIDRETAAGLKSGSRGGSLVVQLLNNWFQRDPGRERFEFYDPLTLAAAIEPEILTTRRVSVAVETESPAELGASRIAAEEGPVSLADEVDPSRFLALMGELLDLEWPG